MELGARVQRKPTYHRSKRVKVINQANKLLNMFISPTLTNFLNDQINKCVKFYSWQNIEHNRTKLLCISVWPIDGLVLFGRVIK